MRKINIIMVLSLFVSIMVCGLPMTAADNQSENFAKNGTLDSLHGWLALKNKESIAEGSFISIQKTENGGNAILINMDFVGQAKFNTNNTGAVMSLKKTLPADSKIKVSFNAKWISGAKYLVVSRTWGGVNATIELADKEQNYSLDLTLPHKTADIIFGLSDSKENDVKEQRYISNGSVLISNVKVVLLED